MEIVSVNGTGETKEAIKEFMERKGATFIGAMNRSPSDLVRRFGVTGYPTNVILNRDGDVVRTLVGFPADGEERMRGALREAGLE